MSWIKTIWGFFFRLFPCPTPVGLRPVGEPGRHSPVLVTCNFDLTVKRVTRLLKRAGVDAWLLVADSKGVNVWCAAGGEELNTHSVVSAVKTSTLVDKVDHRRLILPPLAAPGVRAKNVAKETGWSVHWGPVRAEDIPRYLADGRQRDEGMKRVTYNWRERLDTALGSLFPFYLLGALGFLVFGPVLLLNYLVVGAAAWLLFFVACPWLPGQRGLTKVLFLDLVLGGILLACELWSGPGGCPWRADLIIAMVMLLVYGSELGGLASTLPSDLDPFLARLGVGAIGNVALAGTVRTELLNGYRVLSHGAELCVGCG
ncbi:MAG: hypothetical protein KKC37_14440, partial [Proteobacteria bacterium]|nr:hypothetical protein [Pseudomonadota bacterium]